MPDVLGFPITGLRRSAGTRRSCRSFALADDCRRHGRRRSCATNRDSLEEAAELAAGNPCLAYGLEYEIRPIDPERASAFAVTNETPGRS